MRYAHAHRVLAPVLAMKNEHWLGLASDGCKLLSRFHSRFHLRFQFEVRESAQVTCRDLRGPRSNLLLFFATIREIYVENTKKNWHFSRPRLIYPHRTAESGLSHSTTGFLLEAVSPNFCPLSQMGTTTSGGTRLRLWKSEFKRIKSCRYGSVDFLCISFIHFFPHQLCVVQSSPYQSWPFVVGADFSNDCKLGADQTPIHSSHKYSSFIL